jgi:tetratricopeptide (TPR) repeat protein
MNHEEIIIKYFDNELAGKELEQFNILLNTDKSFMAEFERLNELEKNLNTIAPAFTLDDESFLTQTGNKFTAGKKSAAAKRGLSGSNNILKIFLTSALILSIVVILSFVAYKNYFSEAETVSTEKKDTETAVYDNNKLDIAKQNVRTDRRGHVNGKSKSSGNNIIDMDKSPETKPQNLIQSENKTERIDGELKGTILDKNPVKNQELIAQLQHELDNFRNSGDILNEVWTLKRLGIFYRQLKQYAKSANYLNKALNLSVGLHDVTLQSEIYGELAYLNFKQGNKTQAEVYMKQCLDILRSVESKRTEYWIKKFKKF